MYFRLHLHHSVSITDNCVKYIGNVYITVTMFTNSGHMIGTKSIRFHELQYYTDFARHIAEKEYNREQLLTL